MTTNPGGERLRLARQLAGMTQQEAAKRAGVDARTWRRWETGQTSFLRSLARIAEVLDMPEDDLRGAVAEEDRLARLEAKVDALAGELRAIRALLER